MSLQATRCQIARLEAIGRNRELDERESWHLQRLITTERRYLYSQRVRAAVARDAAGEPLAASPAAQHSNVAVDASAPPARSVCGGQAAAGAIGNSRAAAAAQGDARVKQWR